MNQWKQWGGTNQKWKPTWKAWIFMTVGGISFIGQIAWCALFYNWSGIGWLLYLGWAVFGTGLIMLSMPRYAFMKKGSAPQGEHWLNTTQVVDIGIYAVVRHPIYLSWMLISLSFILISQHWAAPLFAMIPLAGLACAIQMEDKSNVEKFGDDYIRYQQNTPKINIILGIVRVMCRRSEER